MSTVSFTEIPLVFSLFFFCPYKSIPTVFQFKPHFAFLIKQSHHPEKKIKEMKLVWCPDTASKAYIHTVKSCKIFEESSAAELVAALAGGWKPELIVETWYQGGVISTSIGLALASRHTSGRHVCIVPDHESKAQYLQAMSKACGDITTEVVAGDVEEVMVGLVGIDFMVVDCRRKDFARMLRIAKLSHRGAVLVCTNSSPKAHSTFRWRSVIDSGSRIVRSAYLPVGTGVEIAYVATSNGGGSSSSSGNDKESRWVRHIDENSGEEHVYRR